MLHNRGCISNIGSRAQQNGRAYQTTLSAVTGLHSTPIAPLSLWVGTTGNAPSMLKRPRPFGSTTSVQHMRLPMVHFPGVPPACAGVGLICGSPMACGVLVGFPPLARDIRLVWDVGLAWDTAVAAVTVARRAAKVTSLASMAKGGGRCDWWEEESDMGWKARGKAKLYVKVAMVFAEDGVQATEGFYTCHPESVIDSDHGFLVRH